MASCWSGCGWGTGIAGSCLRGFGESLCSIGGESGCRELQEEAGKKLVGELEVQVGNLTCLASSSSGGGREKEVRMAAGRWDYHIR
jgi:hypothetical protein